jgi:NADPH-dependent stearoyl-CoA 9-desaturase
MSGNLCYQIEHHMFPDLPSNRYAEIGVRVRAICEKYDLPYTTGPLLRQYWQSFWTILKLAVPDSWLPGTTDDAPETHSERKFSEREPREVDGKRYGLRSAIKGRSPAAA